MAPFTSVLCALDHSDLGPRVLRHAVGIAGASGAKLTVLRVSDSNPREEHAAIDALLARTLPAGATYVGEPQVRVVRVTQGQPADAILDFSGDEYDLLVAGTHARSGFARWFMGSTSSALLERASCPILLIPPGDLDIVTLTSHGASLHVGTVMAAVDLAEHNRAQLSIAHHVAELARQPLVLLTVVDPGASSSDAEQALFERAQALGPGAVREVIVRTGLVAEEIGHAAAMEPAGLVVMGLRERGLGVPGGIATAVLKTHNALVLAVPAI
jgi:nucleotide-binding universal stress UspA family protein